MAWVVVVGVLLLGTPTWGQDCPESCADEFAAKCDPDAEGDYHPADGAVYRPADRECLTGDKQRATLNRFVEAYCHDDVGCRVRPLNRTFAELTSDGVVEGGMRICTNCEPTTPVTVGSDTVPVIGIDGEWVPLRGAGGLVWTCEAGDCNDLVAATGDTFDASEADSTKPCKEVVAVPGSCEFGECFKVPGDTGTQHYICVDGGTPVRFEGFSIFAAGPTCADPTTGPPCGTASHVTPSGEDTWWEHQGETADVNTYTVKFPEADPTTIRIVTMPTPSTTTDTIVSRTTGIFDVLIGQGTGLKHGRVTTGAISGSTSAAVTLTWGGSAFANTSYTVNCSVLEATTSASTLRVHHVESVTTTTVVVRVVNDDAGSKTGTLHCMAMHD